MFYHSISLDNLRSGFVVFLCLDVAWSVVSSCGSGQRLGFFLCVFCGGGGRVGRSGVWCAVCVCVCVCVWVGGCHFGPRDVLAGFNLDHVSSGILRSFRTFCLNFIFIFLCRDYFFMFSMFSGFPCLPLPVPSPCSESSDHRTSVCCFVRSLYTGFVLNFY
jgi:hypothetical protein